MEVCFFCKIHVNMHLKCNKISLNINIKLCIKNMQISKCSTLLTGCTKCCTRTSSTWRQSPTARLVLRAASRSACSPQARLPADSRPLPASPESHSKLRSKCRCSSRWYSRSSSSRSCRCNCRCLPASARPAPRSCPLQPPTRSLRPRKCNRCSSSSSSSSRRTRSNRRSRALCRSRTRRRSRAHWAT